MKRLLFLLFILPLAAIAQEEVPVIIKQDIPADEQVFNFVEVEPEFPGGNEAMRLFILNNITYPEKSRENEDEGVVYVVFVVMKTGRIVNVRALRGVSEELDAEAERVVKKMPNWVPGTQDGEAVNVRFTLPIQFKI